MWDTDNKRSITCSQCGLIYVIDIHTYLYHTQQSGIRTKLTLYPEKPISINLSKRNEMCVRRWPKSFCVACNYILHLNVYMWWGMFVYIVQFEHNNTNVKSKKRYFPSN